MKQSFVDEGVDPVILEQLQQLWWDLKTLDPTLSPTPKCLIFVRVSKLTRLGGPGLGIRDVLTPPSDQTQEGGKYFFEVEIIL